jgi:hypothetical protein
MSNMKTLINDIKTYLEAGITDGSISVGTGTHKITTKDVYKGINSLPEIVPRRPYIAIDDAGERTEETNVDSTQLRFYTVIFEIGTYVVKRETSLDESLDLSNQVKAVVEKEANRKLNGHNWGIQIQTFEFENNHKFYRARQVAVDFLEVEDQPYDEY